MASLWRTEYVTTVTESTPRPVTGDTTTISTTVVSQTVREWFVWDPAVPTPITSTTSIYDELIYDPNATGEPTAPPGGPGQTAPTSTSAGTSSGGSSASILPSTGATTSSSTSSPSSSPDESNGLSTGAVAGIGIGCAVAGIIIGLLAAWLLLRRRRQPESQTELVSMAAPYHKSEKGMGGGASDDRLSLDNYLLAVTPQGNLEKEFMNLKQLVEQHVENSYHLHQINQIQIQGKLIGSYEMQGILSQVLTGLGMGIESGGITAAELASLALEPHTRYDALQHIISTAAFSSTAISATGPVSLLPPAMADFLRSVPPVERHRGSTFAVDSALSRWRQLSAFLLNPNRSDRTPLVPTEDISAVQAQRLAETLNHFLIHFVPNDRDQRNEQENHLRDVISMCATFGYTILSQPAEFRYRFVDRSPQKSLVVFPGLDQYSDDDGQRFSPPICVVQPEVKIVR